uniref:Uncharacterized protein n=1 Tax=Solanum lycopersicum TaxID=4081 RepID=A0A3Q7IFN0_SOLLC
LLTAAVVLVTAAAGLTVVVPQATLLQSLGSLNHVPSQPPTSCYPHQFLQIKQPILVMMQVSLALRLSKSPATTTVHPVTTRPSITSQTCKEPLELKNSLEEEGWSVGRSPIHKAVTSSWDHQVLLKELQKVQRPAAKKDTSHSPFVSQVVLPSRCSKENVANIATPTPAGPSPHSAAIMFTVYTIALASFGSLHEYCFQTFSQFDVIYANDNEWEVVGQNNNFDSTQLAEPLMGIICRSYRWYSIETKPNVVVWNCRDTDIGFVSCEAKEMLDHLESVLASEHVVVKSGQFIVEVKPHVSHILAFAFDADVCCCYVPWRNKHILLSFQGGSCWYRKINKKYKNWRRMTREFIVLEVMY